MLGNEKLPSFWLKRKVRVWFFQFFQPETCYFISWFLDSRTDSIISETKGGYDTNSRFIFSFQFAAGFFRIKGSFKIQVQLSRHRVDIYEITSA